MYIYICSSVCARTYRSSFCAHSAWFEAYSSLNGGNVKPNVLRPTYFFRHTGRLMRSRQLGKRYLHGLDIRASNSHECFYPKSTIVSVQCMLMRFMILAAVYKNWRIFDQEYRISELHQYFPCLKKSFCQILKNS